MIDTYTIATKISEIKKECKIEQDFDYEFAYQARPKMDLPIIISENNKLKLVSAKLGIYTGLSAISMKPILTNPTFNKLIRKNRCAIPTNCFFGTNNGKSILIKLVKPRLFYMGGVFKKTATEYQFSLLNNESPDVLTFLKYSPVLFSIKKVTQWLSENNLETVMNIADQSGNYWFDYFEVDSKIHSTNKNSKSLLKPIGIAQSEINNRNEQLNSIIFNQERPNKRNSKH
tara:strand:- start:155 stop:844 length:690 start_codon:yes stop_codon:yes gene_type:complete